MEFAAAGSMLVGAAETGDIIVLGTAAGSGPEWGCMDEPGAEAGCGAGFCAGLGPGLDAVEDGEDVPGA